ncbi:MAG: DUF2796 domain-containing protein [Pseudomonadota bacterium]|nr:DUF2796 domain-containing protein [Pseudomonadota bacterium]
MDPMPVRRSRILAAAGALVLALGAHGTAGAQQAAHRHGHLDMDVSIDAKTMTLHLESPLDNFLGFERAPRTDAERERVADMLARLNAADGLFTPDPGAACRLSTVSIDSAVLGVGGAGKDRDGHEHRHEEHGHRHDGHDHRHAHDDGPGDGEHADIDITIVFDCAKADAARFIDVGLFEAFGSLRDITARVVSLQGQFRRELRPGNPRLRWAD